MENSLPNQRKFERYETQAQIYFCFSYDINAFVKYSLLDKIKHKIISKKYLALGKNVSAQGLCFASHQQLTVGDMLSMEVFLPGTKQPIPMEGEVRWSKALLNNPKHPHRFDTGIKVVTVNGESVEATIHQDETYQLIWSVVLESVLGSYRIFTQTHKKQES